MAAGCCQNVACDYEDACEWADIMGPNSMIQEVTA